MKAPVVMWGGPATNLGKDVFLPALHKDSEPEAVQHSLEQKHILTRVMRMLFGFVLESGQQVVQKAPFLAVLSVLARLGQPLAHFFPKFAFDWRPARNSHFFEQVFCKLQVVFEMRIHSRYQQIFESLFSGITLPNYFKLALPVTLELSLLFASARAFGESCLFLLLIVFPFLMRCSLKSSVIIFSAKSTAFRNLLLLR